jgi:OFA family oxalate/formate antiporter-like MFS transporter
MFIAFATGALMLLMLSAYGQIPIVFVLSTAIYFGVFGEIYSLFPATSGDTFGSKYATTNNGMLYTAKGTASLLVPLSSVISSKFGWQAVFVIAVALNATAALMALFVIKPLRRAFILGNETCPSPFADRFSTSPAKASPISVADSKTAAQMLGQLRKDEEGAT